MTDELAWVAEIEARATSFRSEIMEAQVAFNAQGGVQVPLEPALLNESRDAIRLCRAVRALWEACSEDQMEFGEVLSEVRAMGGEPHSDAP